MKQSALEAAMAVGSVNRGKNQARGARITLASLAVAALSWLGGCRDDFLAPPPPPPPPPPPVLAAIVSNPVRPTAPASARASFSVGRTSGSDVVYVSLTPGTVPNGGLATIRNTRTGSSALAAMAAGGFDPVAVEASVGDTLAVDVQLAGGGDSVLLLTVPMAARPIVVRTDPPPHKRDVPLNARIVVVFSEPIRPSSVTGIRLLRAGAPVSGQVTLTADGLRAELRPDGLLAPNTDYELSVSIGVTDLSGDPLQQPVAAEFTTGTTVAVASVATDQPALFINSFNGNLRTFNFSAILDDAGRFSGSFTIFYPGTGARLFGRVTCFAIMDGKAAWVAGVAEGAGRPDLVGVEWGWRAMDNGPPEGGVVDALSLAVPLDGPISAQDFCATTPVTDSQYGDITLNPLVSGNIVVNSSGPPPPPPPSGMSQIAFWSGGIRVADADGSNARQLTTSTTDYQPAWSPDGRMIAFARGQTAVGRSDQDIYVMNADGTGQRPLTSDISHDGSPAWSPDGTRIAFLRDGGLYVMNATDGTGTTRLGPGGCCSDDGIAWSPDGSRIAFSAPGNPGYHIYVMNADGTGVTQLTTDSTNRDIDPAWSPDGVQIAFKRHDATRSAIYVVRATGSAAATRLTDTGDGFGGPSWSPDGTMIAFGGFGGIAIMNADGSVIRRVAYGNSPQWSRVGTMPPPPVFSVQKVAGDRQRDTVLATLAVPLRVGVISSSNNAPAVGVAVSWTLPDSRYGSLSASTTVTDGQGMASVAWTLGAFAGPQWEYRVLASVAGGFGSLVAFTATVNPGAPVTLCCGSQDGFGLANATLDYYVLARDGHGYVGAPGYVNGLGNPVTGVAITWAVASGGGSITPAQDTTAFIGYYPGEAYSHAVHTLGSNDGTAVVTATAPTMAGAPQVTFTAHVVTAVVHVPDYAGEEFYPDTVAVPSGRTVAWSWYGDEDSDEHNVTFEDDPTQPTSSPTQGHHGNNFFRTFAGGPRTIRYRCTLHSTDFTHGEVGAVIVQ